MKTRRELGPLRTTIPVFTAVFVVALLAGATVCAAAPVERHDWSVGLAVGVGHANVNFAPAAATELEWARGASPQFRIGRMLGDHFMVGLEERQWLNEGGVADYKVRGNVQNFSLVLTAFPGRTSDMTSGIFLQAGGGIAHGRLSALEPIPGGNEWGETFEVVYKHDASGWAAMVGAGYEFRVARHFTAGVGTSYNVLHFDDDIYDKVEFIPGALNLSWYF